MTHKGEIDPFPLHIPLTDIHTIGAGGGSIATVMALGNLTVGPQSAGAMPGPACYDQGGTAPTLTGANLVLGRIPPHLLGGEVPLNVERAHQAIYDRIAVPLGMVPWVGICTIVFWQSTRRIPCNRAISTGTTTAMA
jgi:N-methylhydantoinase A